VICNFAELSSRNAWASVADVFDRLHIQRWPEDRDYNTAVGFALHRFGHIPNAGDRFTWEGWRFEVLDMDGLRVAKLLAAKNDKEGELL
jgi:putative hemolysin